MKKTLMGLVVCIGMICGFNASAHEDCHSHRSHGHGHHHEEVVIVYEDVWVPGYCELVYCCGEVRYVHHPGYWKRVARRVCR